MLYARLNALGEIESLHGQPTPEASHPVDPNSAAVRHFLGQGDGDVNSFANLDADFVRVIEDLIDLLAGKGLIAVGELPVAVQAKYLARKEHRESRTTAPGYLGSGFVTVIDDSAFGQLADLDGTPPRERKPRS